MSTILLGAGCFWGVQEYFRKIEGISNTKVGYSGGHTINPTYEEVCYGDTDHAEVILINFDENVITLNRILEHFWKCHDPTQLNRQGLDVGRQYRSVIYCYEDNQINLASKSKIEAQKNYKKTIVTEIKKSDKFYLAEDYHQFYINKRQAS